MIHKSRRLQQILILGVGMALLVGAATVPATKPVNPNGFAPSATAPFVKEDGWEGKKSQWNGFVRWDFQVAGKDAIVVLPEKAAEGKPWIWRAQFWNTAPGADLALLKRGYAVVFL